MCDKPTHPHQEVMKAWAEGKIIQFKCPDESNWGTAKPFELLSWMLDLEYRVKPETKKYRVALMKHKSDTWTLSANDELQASRFQESSDFSKWLTDWIEYDVEE